MAFIVTPTMAASASPEKWIGPMLTLSSAPYFKPMAIHLAHCYGGQIAHQHTQQDWDNLEDALAPLTRTNYRYHSYDG